MSTQRVNILLAGSQLLKDEVLAAAIGGLDHTSLVGELVLKDPTHPVRKETVIKLSAEHDVSSVATTVLANPETAAQWDVLVLVCATNDQASIDALINLGMQRNAPITVPTVLCMLQSPFGQQADTKTLEETVSTRSHFYYGSVVVPFDDATPEVTPRSTNSLSNVQQDQPPRLTRDVLGELIRTCLLIGIAPSHMLWDEPLQKVTAVGIRALRKAFAILDKNKDGRLDKEEIRAWQTLMFHNSASDEDIETLLQYVVDLQEQQANENGTVLYDEATQQLTLSGFMNVIRVMLYEGRHRAVWAMLNECGVRTDGNSHSPKDLASVRVGSKQYTTLSSSGAQFFSSLISSNKFGSIASMWSMTHGCPWSDVTGLNNDDGSSGNIVNFIERWRYMAIHRRHQVIAYARTWGFQGDVNRLFTKRYKRAYRLDRSDGTPFAPPNTISVLVAGSRGGGKTSLIQRMCNVATDPATGAEVIHSVDGSAPTGVNRSSAVGASYTQAATLIPNSQDGDSMGAGGLAASEEYRTVIFTEVSEAELPSYLHNKEKVALIDMVLLVCDGSDPYSFTTLMEQHLLLTGPAKQQYSVNSTAQLPLGVVPPALIVLSKADLPVADQQCAVNPEDFAQENDLHWPPIITSALGEAPVGLENEVDVLLPTIAEVIEYDGDLLGEAAHGGNEPVSAARWARRALVITTAVGVTIWVLKKLFGSRKSSNTTASSN